MTAHVTLSPKQLGIAMCSVAGGGAAGTLLRDMLLKFKFYTDPRSSAQFTLVDWTHQIPWILLAINTIGVFLATYLLRHVLHHHDPNDPLRLLLVTGFLGGLTSYSGLFVALAALWHVTIGGCFLVGVAAIVAGIFAGWLGLGRKRLRG